jgi:hypothetical protein
MNGIYFLDLNRERWNVTWDGSAPHKTAWANSMKKLRVPQPVVASWLGVRNLLPRLAWRGFLFFSFFDAVRTRVGEGSKPRTTLDLSEVSSAHH